MKGLLRGIFIGSMACLASAAAQADTFSFSGIEETYVVPSTGIYEVIAYGAQGGSFAAGSASASGGLGAEIGGTVSLISGQTLIILVGLEC